jgi:DNA-binding transcriptional MerR regulator
VIVVNVAALIATGAAARELGIDRGTLVRWWQHGLVTPAIVTAGGHARWDLQELRQQLKDRRQRDE